MDTTSKPANAEKNVVFMPAIYNETVRLLLESYEYFSTYGPEDQDKFANEAQRTLYSSEMSRITVRLSSVMAWLMVRKAIFTGKVTPQMAKELYNLDSREICLESNEDAETILPAFMTYLLESSLMLYQRVIRLDEMAKKSDLPSLIH